MPNAVKDGSRWGDWHLDARALLLVLKRDRHRYEIDLADITDSAHMLDWIFQLRGKTWATNDIIGDLVSAFDDLLDPQGTICGEGRNKTINAREHIERLIRRG
jgi:hypothetical protein